MSPTSQRLVSAFAVMALAACSGAPGGQDGGADAGPGDAGTGDAGSGDAGTDAGQPTLGVLTAVELHDALAAKDFLMIDVHVPYAQVIPGTDTSIPYNDVTALVQYIGADLNRKVVLTCYSDHMSSQAGGALVARGYRRVSHLQGGMAAWTAAGYALQP
ncbi:MAG: rhodanese-like domain-containing protein [Myxococcaceae bacterium]